jgi:hypothetical protein
MDTFQILFPAQCAFFLIGLPIRHSSLGQNQPDTIILNADPHTEDGSHWLAMYIKPRFSTSFYFDSYGLPSFVPAIESFLRRICTIWEYNKTATRINNSLWPLLMSSCTLHGQAVHAKRVYNTLQHTSCRPASARNVPFRIRSCRRFLHFRYEHCV